MFVTIFVAPIISRKKWSELITSELRCRYRNLGVDAYLRVKVNTRTGEKKNTDRKTEQKDRTEIQTRKTEQKDRTERQNRKIELKDRTDKQRDRKTGRRIDK